MKHLSEDELILYFYGESRRAGAIEQHIGECDECSEAYREIAGTLALVPAPEPPARGEEYGAQVWQRVRYSLPYQEHVGWSAWMWWNRVPLAAAAAILLAAGVTLGYVWNGRPTAQVAANVAGGALPATAAALLDDPSERVRLAAISDHLEQSERVLLDVVNAEGSPVDVSAQQAWAATLVDSNRFYRDAASRAGDAEIAGLLDDLERSLLDIVHGPSKLTQAQFDDALMRLDAAALLFKVRVLSDELHERESAPVAPWKSL